MTRIAVVSPTPVPPAANGASVRIERLTAWLRGRGHELCFVWAQTEKHPADPAVVEARLETAWGRAVVLPHRGRVAEPRFDDWRLDDWVDPDQEGPFRQSMDRFEPDIVLANYVFLSRFLTWSPPSTLKYLDTHDRLSRRDLYEREGLQPGFFYTTEEEEFRGCQRADAVFAIQDEEVQHFASSGVPVATVGHAERADYRPAPDNPQSVVGFVAAYNRFNAASLSPFLDAVSRSGVLQRHDASMRIAGSLIRGARARGRVAELPDRVEDVGFVPDLDGFYDELDLVVNPTVVGTGLKIKTVEAIARGKPLVSTVVGSEGLARRSPRHWAAGIDELVDHMDQVLSAPGELTALANVSRHLHAEYLLNLERNLVNLFDESAVQAHVEGRIAQHVARTTGSLNADGPTSSLTLEDRPMSSGRVRVAHVVNPVPAGFTSDLYAAQPLTFESLRRARHHVVAENVDVDLVSCLARTDDGPWPEGFRQTSRRARVVTDVGDFRRRRPLPLLRDVLDAVVAESDADWFVYTNADIALMPHFYGFVAEKIRHGHDALVINRRTIPRSVIGVADLNQLYSLVGENHPGFDCFVFSRQAYKKFELGDVAVGVHLVGRVLLWNVLANAHNPLLVDRDHLTFHLGDDNAGKRPELLDYTEHNTQQAIDVLERLDARGLVAPLEKMDDGPFAPRVENLGFNPATLQEVPGRIARELRDRPVMVHALFRTGSTFLWHRARRSKLHIAYYEPLHEDLSRIRPENLDHFRRLHSLDARHRFDGDWFFREYEGLLDEGVSGVRGHRTRFAYEGFADNSEQPLLRRYVQGLLDHADRRQPFLQFNRSALRQRWFHRNFPDAQHVYLVREPRQQWGSYISFFEEGGPRGFSRNDALIAGMNMHRDLVRPLGELVELHHETSVGNYFARYDAVWDEYSWHERYTLFYYLWLQSLLEAAATGSHIVSMDAVARNRWQRLRFENHLAVRGAPLSLRGLRMTCHDEAELPLPPPEMERVERRVQATIGRAFGLDRVGRLPPRWRALADAVRVATRGVTRATTRTRGGA